MFQSGSVANLTPQESYPPGGKEVATPCDTVVEKSSRGRGEGKGLWDKIKSGGERISRSANKLARDEKYLPFLKLDSEQFSTNRRRLPGIRCRGRPFKTQPLSKGVDSLPLPRASKLSFAF